MRRIRIPGALYAIPLRNTPIPHIVENDTYDDIRKCLRNLEKECDILNRLRRPKRKDPYSANHTYSKGRRESSTRQDFCTRALTNP